MDAAAKQLKLEDDFAAWSDTWLKTAGCNLIWHDVTEADGKITKFVVNQKINEHGEGNRLRKQKYKVAFYDEKMEIIDTFDITTKDDQESFEVPEMVGKAAPHAYHINYMNYGFAKFVIDAKSLSVFENNLQKIESSMSRKQLYNILGDMLKQNAISGAQVLKICKT